MDKVINMARELGNVIQADERFIRFSTAQQLNDEDAELQRMIGLFGEKRDALNAEIQKGNQDSELIQQLNENVKSIYADIFANNNMKAYVGARDEIQALVGFINQIITGSANGLDPETIEFQQDCGGVCSSCSGCD